MKVKYKLASGFIAVASLIWIVGIITVIVSRNNLKNTIEQYSTASITRISHYIDKEIYSKIEYFLLRSKGAMLQRETATSNTYYSRQKNPLKRILEIDSEWKALRKEQSNSLIDSLINKELTTALKAEIQFFDKKHKQRIISEILVTDSLGALVSQTTKASDYYQADEEWWQKAKSDGLYVTEFTYDESSSTYAMEICIRVEDQQGRFIGVLKAVVCLENLLKSVEEYLAEDVLSQEIDANYIIFDKAGKIFYSSKDYKFLDQYPHAGEINEYFSKNTNHYESVSPNSKKILVFFRKLNGYREFTGFGWTLAIEYSEADVFSTIYILRNQIIISFLVITILAILISLFISEKILKPVKELFNATTRIGDGNYNHHLEVFSNDEFGELSRSFNNMSKKINDNNLKIMMQNEEMKQINQSLQDEIAEREKVQNDLWQEKERLSITLKSISDAVIATDKSGKIIIMNETAEHLTGCKLLESKDMFLEKTFNVKEYPCRNFSDILNISKEHYGLDTFSEQVTLLSSSGAEYIVSNSISPIIKDDGDIIGIILIFKDITEKSRIEKQLVVSENKFRNLFNNSVLGIFRSLPEGKFLDVNPAFAQIFKYESTQDVINSITNISEQLYSNPDDRKLILEKLQTGSGSGIFELKFKAKDGQIITGNLSIRIEKDNTGEISYLEGFVEDITERKNAEENFFKIFNSSPEFIAITSINDGRHLNVNTSYCNLFGYDFEEIIGKTSLELNLWVEYEYRKKIASVIEEEGLLKNVEIKLRNRSGRIIVCLASFVKILYSAEECLIIIGRDITERKEWEDSLANEKERLSVTLRSIGDGVITTDVDGKVIMLNRIAEILTGWSQQEAAGKHLEEIFNIINATSRQKCDSPFSKVISTNIITELESDTILISKDGTERIIADSGSPIRDRNSKIIGVVLVFRDVTQKRKIEDELQKIQKIESIGVLAGGLAHDFNNILTSIVGSISLALLKPDIEHKDKYLKLAENAATRAKDITYQLLTFSKGGNPVKKLASLENLLKMSASFAGSGSNAEISFDIENNLWHTEIDEGQISQVINNITLNAIHAMPSGGKILFKLRNCESRVGNDLLPPGKFVSIQISDTGEGISKENIKKIFDPYFTTKKKGSGLGLAISYSIIKKHNGFIDVHSSPDIGTEFTIYLPASVENIPTQIELSEPKINRGKGYILIMDDEESIRFIMKDILTMLGYSVNSAIDGTEAIEKYQEAKRIGSPFDLVIMDLTIPGGMGGKDTIEKLLKIDPWVKAIVSSGYSNDPVMGDFKKYGFKGRIAKPYRVDEVGKTVGMILNRQ